MSIHMKRQHLVLLLGSPVGNLWKTHMYAPAAYQYVFGTSVQLYASVQAECGNLSGNKLTRNLSGNTRSQSSQLAEPLWTDPGIKTGINVRELTSNFKKSEGGQ